MALTPEQLEMLGDELVPIYQQMEQDVINDIARRVKGAERWTETAELMAISLQKAGFSPAEIRKHILEKITTDPEYVKYLEENTVAYKKEVEQIIKDTVEGAKKTGNELIAAAGNMAWNADMAVWALAGKKLTTKSAAARTVRLFKDRLNDELKNITRTTAFRGMGSEFIKTADVFYKEMDSAMAKVASGAFTAQQATEDVVKRLAGSGIRMVNYASGINRNIDTAARLCLQTTSAQLAGAVSMENAEEMGEDLVEVSSHMGARTNGSKGPSDHLYWQGKVYSISGESHGDESERLGYPIRKLSEATGYGETPLGLCGYNCAHTFYTFFEGISEPNPIEETPPPVAINGREYTYYQATQKQRQYEREIRSLKRQQACGLNVRAKINQKTAEYRAFSVKAGISPKPNRLRVVNVGESGIIKETKLYRKKGSDLIESMPKEQLHRIVKSFKEAGGIIQMNEATDRFLDLRKAEGITYNNDTILLRQSPGRAAVFEELIHTAQFRTGQNDGTPKARLLCEISAQQKLLKYQKAYKLTGPEIKQTELALKKYQKDLENLTKGGG